MKKKKKNPNKTTGLDCTNLTQIKFTWNVHRINLHL